MDPSFRPVWSGNEPVTERTSKGNVATSWLWREMGVNPKGRASNSKVLQEAAEDHLVNKTLLTERSCELPGVPKSTFLMVFSPDGTKVASTHGNHKIYVSELSTGKHVKTLSGHPRTPWCVAFHPSRTQLLGSGCLDGQVRVWDLNGGSEVWTVESKTVIASIAFHPRDRLLVIATYNELYFWDWSQPQPFTKVQTINIKEKVRFVSFDTLGHKLITGISVCNFPGMTATSQHSVNLSASDLVLQSAFPTDILGVDRNGPFSHSSQLVHRYDNLLRNYLFAMQQSQLNTTDRGTDPMEVDSQNQNGHASRNAPNSENMTHPPETSTAQTMPSSSSLPRWSSGENGAGNRQSGADTSNLTFTNLDVQSIPLGNSGVFQQLSSRADSHTSDTMTFATTSSPRVSSRVLSRVALGRDMLRSNVRFSAFRPLHYFGGPLTNSQRNSNVPSSATTDRLVPNSPNRPIDANYLRDELTASLNRLQGYMENSIDETLNIVESLNMSRTNLVTNASNPLTRECPVGNSRNTPPTDSVISFPQVNTSSPQATDSHPGEQRLPPSVASMANPRVMRDLSDMSFEQHLHNIMRDSNSSFMNLVTESAEYNNVRQILQHFRRGRRIRRNASSTGERSRSPFRNVFMSSDDGSDSDREMFSPLPWYLNPPTRNLGNFSLDSISIEPMSTSAISRHIDHEYVRINQSNPIGLYGLSDIPPPSRPDSPTFPTNMMSSTLPRYSRNSNTANNTNMPSTSRQHADSLHRQRTSSAPPESESSNSNETERDRAFSKVARGVQAINRHTESLVNLCSNRPSLPYSQLRGIWHDLRIDIVSIERQSPSRGAHSYFTLSARARCDLLTNMASGSQSVPNTTVSDSNRQNDIPRSQSSSSIPSNPGPSTSAGTNTPNTPTSNSSETRRTANGRLPNRRTYPPSSRTRLYQDRILARKIRLRSYLHNRLNRLNNSTIPYRNYGRMRLSSDRELEVTRVFIRHNARRVLTIMFGIMMDCLDADQLGEQLISMLRALKKALGLTCLLISHSLNRESPSTSNNSSQNTDPTSPTTNARSTSNEGTSSNSQSNETRSRIAVQISAANRNNSSNARKRRESYYLFKRFQALKKKSDSNDQLQKKVLSAVESSQPSTSATARQSTSSADLSQPSTSGLRNSRKNERTNVTEPSTQPSTTRSTERQFLPGPSFYSGVFRRFLGSNYGFIRDISALRNRRAEYLSSGNLTANTRPRSQAQQDISHVFHHHPPPHRRIFSMATRSGDFIREGNRASTIIESIINNVVVPLVRVNDVPVSEMQNSENPPPPPLRQAASVRFMDPSPMQNNPRPAEEHIGPNIFSAGPNLILETPESPVHRIQVWDFTRGQLPEIENTIVNVVVPRCKIHNDASIDISRDGRLLVALLPTQRMRNLTHQLGIYSLDWKCLGDLLYTALLEQNVVSISLSPCARHLAVGLGSRRVSLQPYRRNGIMSLIYRLGEIDKYTKRGSLTLIRSLEQSWELDQLQLTSLNCLRWAPQSGQGLVYANNTGQLKILS